MHETGPRFSVAPIAYQHVNSLLWPPKQIPITAPNPQVPRMFELKSPIFNNWLTYMQNDWIFIITLWFCRFPWMGGDYDAALSAFAGKRALSSVKVRFLRRAKLFLLLLSFVKLVKTFDERLPVRYFYQIKIGCFLATRKFWHVQTLTAKKLR